MIQRIMMVLACIFSGSLTLAAAQIRIEWSSARVETGQMVSFSIMVPGLTRPTGVSLALRQTNQDWEIAGGGNAGITLGDSGVSGQVQCFAVTDSLFPGLVIRWTDSGQSRTLVTPPVWFFVSAPETDLAAQPPVRGLRGPVVDAFPWLLVLGLLILVALVVASLMIMRRRKRGLVLPGIEEIPDPWELARKRLEILRSNMPHDAEGIKEHIFLLSETLKQYLSGRSGLHLVEQTSEEVVRACRGLAWAGDAMSTELKAWLVRGDMAKFARQIPSYEEFETFSSQLETWLELAESGWKRCCLNGEAET